MNKQELEKRLINFAADIIRFVESLPNTKAANHLAGQLLRSGTSPALNYGEAQDAESTKDFIHKYKIILKELRETLIAQKIVKLAIQVKEKDLLNKLIKESNELIAIFVSSVKTLKKKI